MTDSGPIASLAVQRQRLSRREEFLAQVRLCAMLAEYLDPACTYWTSLENKPRSPMGGVFQRMRGCRPGLPDLVVIQQQPGRAIIVFVELKSRRGLASKAQKQARAEMLPAGAGWIMARSARAAMVGLQRAGVKFRRPWKPPPLEPWEGPFSDPNQRLPQEPGVRAERRAAQHRWRERQRARKAAKLAAERDDAAGGDMAA
jgi:VRR-NUC domain